MRDELLGGLIWFNEEYGNIQVAKREEAKWNRKGSYLTSRSQKGICPVCRKKSQKDTCLFCRHRTLQNQTGEHNKYLTELCTFLKCHCELGKKITNMSTVERLNTVEVCSSVWKIPKVSNALLHWYQIFQQERLQWGTHESLWGTVIPEPNVTGSIYEGCWWRLQLREGSSAKKICMRSENKNKCPFGLNWVEVLIYDGILVVFCLCNGTAVAKDIFRIWFS